jgi:DNA-directed RNA polymerase subunit RPC12/RpoP
MDRPKCKKCESGFVYIKKDGSIVCRRCGYITKPKEVEK